MIKIGDFPQPIPLTTKKNNTTIVRNAVATCEFVFLIPHLAKIDVIPAKNAEPNAHNIHI